MNRKYLAALALLAVALTSCGTKPSQPPTVSAGDPPAVSQEPVQEPAASEPLGPEALNVTWDLRDANYQRPAQENPFDFDFVKVPDYNGMDEAAFYDWAYEQGFNSETGPYPVWAEDGVLSSPVIYVAYTSNKDCVAQKNYTGRSIFLLNCTVDEERVLLSGTDGNAYSVVDWLDIETLICRRSGTEDSFGLCSVEDDSVVWLDGLFESNWGPLGSNGLLFAEAVGQELRLVRANRDGSVTELARAPFEGASVNSCAISPDGSYVCYILQKDMMSFERYIVVWNTTTGQMTEIEPPQMAAGEDNMGAIQVEYSPWGAFEVEFSVDDAPDPNGHHERWWCISDAWCIPRGEID